MCHVWLQAHLLGMFENVAHVEFHEREYDRILSCISREGEVVTVGIININNVVYDHNMLWYKI